VPTLYYISFLFVPIGSIYVAIHEFNLVQNGRKNFASMVTFSILLLVNIVFLAIYTRLSENYTLEKEKIAYVQQMNMIAINTREQKRILEAFHAEKHDAINKLIVLRDELEHGKRENVLERLEKIISHIDVSESISQSGNSTVDALINFKYAAAREQGIVFQLKIFIPDTLPIDQCDLGVVLGNSLDNAVTAAAQCKNHEKTVQITIGVKKGSLVIVIKNPYEQELKRNKMGNFLSTKRDSAGHGYGVGSIQKVAEKYNGEVLIETENQVFSIMIILGME
ncbi:MAG: GHKL domain-containing protein, partial [Lachnospiraceae bacterium]|nr:GHKL domain-containing protein [Lachnospiraceae bacterium]